MKKKKQKQNKHKQTNKLYRNNHMNLLTLFNLLCELEMCSECYDAMFQL